MAHPSAPERLNRLSKILNAKSYLEIGVQAGRTFFQVDIPYKIAVDPKFLFDVESARTAGCDFYNCTSDDFFRSYSTASGFDIIFIDGLHTFDQTYRDFCNSLLIAHKKTVIVIDDTLPSDMYSSLRSQEICDLRRRLEAPGSLVGEWRGDVYKLVLLLKQFHTSLSYATVQGGGPAQTFVWRTEAFPSFSPCVHVARSKDFERLCLEFIYRLPSLDFTWLLENKDLLQLCDAEGFFGALQAAETKIQQSAAL